MLFTNRCGWLLAALALPAALLAQKEPPITLANPSFEGSPTIGVAPSGWIDCGSPNESPPDVQPGAFHVTKLPSNGSTYLGMVVRDNETWESIAQRLSRPIEAGKCYEFSFDLCRADTYISLSRTTGEEVNYGIPVRLIIYGGNSYCDSGEKLYESPEITHTRWLTYTTRLKPKKNYTFIRMEAYYKVPILVPYNGNVLVDNLSAIKPVPCTEKPPVKPIEPKVIAEGPKPPPRTAVAKATPTAPKVKPKVTPPPPAPPPSKLDYKTLRKGDVVRLDKIYFEADKYDLKSESMASLQTLADFLKIHPDVTVEVGGHTNNRPSDDFAQKLSTSRAKAVAEWLIAQGIKTERVQFKGYGKNNPIEPNLTAEGRQKNQRVEIKILDIKKESDKKK